MTASQNPQPDPDPAQHHIARGDESSTGAEVHAGESAAPAIESPQGPAAGNGGVNGRREETVDGRAGGVLGRAVSGRGARWAALAIACVVAGTVASVLVARGVARDDEAKARTAFHQSVTSTDGSVTSTGWESYPILRFPDVPTVSVEVVDRPEEPSAGAGEAAAVVPD